MSGSRSTVDVVCLHGLGGTPATVAPLAEALRADGWTVDAPLLPGHGTRPEDLLGVPWADWLAAVPPARVVVGQSLGGTLALAAAAQGRAEAVVCVNAIGFGDPDALAALEGSADEWIDAGPPDIRAAGVTEDAYRRLPAAALLEMTRGAATLDLAAVVVPVLLVTSADDAVVDPYHSDVIASGVRGPVERLRLPRSGHVASLDLDADLLIARVCDWVAARLRA